MMVSTDGSGELTPRMENLLTNQKIYINVLPSSNICRKKGTNCPKLKDIGKSKIMLLKMTIIIYQNT